MRELLVLIAPANRRDELVDTLMACENVAGFTRSPAAGFSRHHSHFSLRESVQGYVDQERFEVVCDKEVVDDLLKRFECLAGRDQFYFWSTPLSREGTLGEPLEGKSRGGG